MNRREFLNKLALGLGAIALMPGRVVAGPAPAVPRNWTVREPTPVPVEPVELVWPESESDYLYFLNHEAYAQLQQSLTETMDRTIVEAFHQDGETVTK